MKGNLYSSFGRMTVHELHTVPQIDVLYLGDSHIYSGINIQDIDEYSGVSNLTAGIASQEIDGSYALLREAYIYHPEIKKVYIDVDYFNNYEGDFKNRNHLRNIYAISDNLENKKIKWDYLYHSSDPKYMINHLLVFGKNKINGNPKTSIKTIKTILNGDYFKYEYPADNNSTYMGKGFITTEKTKNPGIIFTPEKHQYFDRDKVSKDWIKNMNNIMKFCKEHNIECTFIKVPESDFKVFSYINYDDYINFMKDSAAVYNCKYYDFTLCKELNLIPENYWDTEHLNFSGSRIFTKVFWDTIQDIDNIDSHFYSSLKEKKDIIDPKIAGWGFVDSDDRKIYTFNPITNKEMDNLTFDILFVDKKDNITVLQSKSKNRTIPYPENSEGAIRVICYKDDVYYTEFNRFFNTKLIK